MQTETAPTERPARMRMLRMQDVLEKTGMSKSFVEAKVREGEFPQPVKLGARASGFIEAEVDQWLQQMVEVSRAKERELAEFRRFTNF